MTNQEDQALRDSLIQAGYEQDQALHNESNGISEQVETESSEQPAEVKPNEAKVLKQEPQKEETPEVKAEVEEVKPEELAPPKSVLGDKDQERQERSWVKLNKEKEEFYKEKTQFEEWKKSEREKIKQEVSQEYADYRPDLVKITPKDYLEKAEQLEAEAVRLKESGDLEEAFEKVKLSQEYKLKATELESKLQKYSEYVKQQEEYTKKVEFYKKEQLESVKQTYPDLEKEGSELNKCLGELYKDNELKKFFETHPNGYWYAAHVANLQVQASSASALAKEVQTLKEQLKQQKIQSTPSKGYTEARSKKSFEEMDGNDQAQELIKLAQLADAGM